MEGSQDLRIEASPHGRNGCATVTVHLGGDVLLVESCNLTKSKARAGLAAAIAERCPAVDRPAVEDELLRLAADLAKPKENGPEPAPGDNEALLAAMPQAVREEARAMLEAPDLFKRIVEDIQAVGVAGERQLAATIYLVGTSRLLLKPLAAIVQGPSASGKSYTIEKVADLFPPEAVVVATQMTPQALFHMKPGALRHRFIVAGERSRRENDETAEATRALREMLSAGRLVKLMPMKIDGEIRTEQIVQDGPVAYVESTTLARIFDEDQNRCLLLSTDERAEQTEKIVATLAAWYARGPAVAPQHIVHRHHALQRMLQSSTVVVPFAERLAAAFTCDRVEARRAFPQLMGAIQTSALLHQRQRKVDIDGQLVAEPDDYRLAAYLLAVPMRRMLGGRVSDGALRFLERLRGRVAAGERFTSKEAMDGESASKRSVYGWLAELHDAAVVEQVEAQHGRTPAVWTMTDAPGDIGPALPSEKELFGT